MTKVLSRLLYASFIHAFDCGLWIMSFFNSKAKHIILGRQHNKSIFTSQNPTLKSNKWIWVHAASLGEYLQIQPLIAILKKNYPSYKVAVSFFSPSGFKSIDDTLIDLKFYLPSDHITHINPIIQNCDIRLFILAKYDFWWNLLAYLQLAHIPTLLIAASFRPHQYFFKWPFKSLTIPIFQDFTLISVQNHNDKKILQINNITDNILITGDTRVDNVIKRLASLDYEKYNSIIPQHKKVIVYGSVYVEDMPYITDTINNNDFFHIIVPHDILSNNIQKIRKAMPVPTDLWTENTVKQNVLIVNKMGILYKLYALAHYVYIGGGFKKGIHNTLEPAAFHIPLFFGPKHKKFYEATAFIDRGCAFEIINPNDLAKKIKALEAQEDKRKIIKNKLKQYFDDNQGATELIYDYIANLKIL